jgi:hypothetical protein
MVVLDSSVREEKVWCPWFDCPTDSYGGDGTTKQVRKCAMWQSTTSFTAGLSNMDNATHYNGGCEGGVRQLLCNCFGVVVSWNAHRACP